MKTKEGRFLYPKFSAAGELASVEDWQLFCAIEREVQETRKRRGNPQQLECRLGDGHGFLR